MEVGLPIDGPLLLVGVLLTGGVLIAGYSDRLRVPGALLFLALGMLVGDDVLGLVEFDNAPLAQSLGIGALIVILFEGGLTTKPVDLRRGGVPGFVLSNIGVLVTAAVTAAALVLVLDVSWHTGFLLGAIVGSTDAAAVFDLLRRAPLPRRIAATLEVESGANDPFAVMLTVGLLAAAERSVGWSEWLVFGARQLFGGIAVGVVAGVIGVAILRGARLRAHGLYPVLAFAIAAATYGAGAVSGSSGLLAVYLCGILIGTFVPRHRRVIRNFATSVANTADIGLFLLLGLLVFPTRLSAVIGPALAVTAVLLLVARPVAVAVCLTPFRVPWRHQVVASWAGLRGAVPIVLATLPFTAGYPAGDTIFNVVFFVVLVSVALQGVTVVPLVERLGLATPRAAWENLAEVLPVEGVEADLVELAVTEQMPIARRRLRDVDVPQGLLVTALIREHAVLVPTGETTIEPGDLALIAVSGHTNASAVVTAWARQDGADRDE